MAQKPDVDPGKWPDISRVFAAAAPLDGPARRAYLGEACQHDSALRAAVESLLGAHDAAGSFGDGPVLGSTTVRRLSPGSQLGPFRIESLLGAGGMGEVYRGYDTKLHRAVAIKVLPDFFAQDPSRLARFGEEARALAALNHPHVGAIYGLEESAGVLALVLELIEGPTLAERLATGPLPFDEVIRIARQMAEGLEAAHERGIVHRDLKPGNIKFSSDGNIKILDFGLARIAGSPPSTELAASTTTPSPRDATQFGMVLGTVGYMSPEQARGQPVDKRTDIWAFGCVLFEMCAEQPPFAGATISDARAAVMEREPDWKLVRADTPPTLVRLLRRCLTKDPKLRLRDIGEARIALSPEPATEDLPVRPRTRRGAAIASVLGLVALASVVAVFVYGPPRSTRFEVPPPEGTNFNISPGVIFFAVSPDGSQLAFVAGPARGSTGRSRVWLRAVANREAQPLPGTEGATTVFWSPDGRKLAFIAERKLMRIDFPDRAVVKICDVGALYSHGTWGEGVILLGRSNATSIDAVPAAGGVPVQILRIDQSVREVRVHWPWFLPDGKRFLYTSLLDDGEGEVRLAQLRLNDREGNARPLQREEDTRKLMSANSNAQWVDPDVVVFVRESVLMAQRVNLEGGRPLAEPFPIADRVEYFLTTSRALFSSSSMTGSVAYHSGQDIGQLVRADRNGNEVGTIGSPADYQAFSARLSRDDSALLIARKRLGPGTYDIWRMNLGRATEQLDHQLTSDRGSEVNPVWINDGAIAFTRDSPGTLPHLFRKDLATSKEEQLLPPLNQQNANDVSPRGDAVAYAERTPEGFRLFELLLAGGVPPKQMLLGQLSASQMRYSPDGHAMTFASFDGEGRMDLYVSTVPVTRLPEPIAKDVLGPARWSRDGRQIFYVSGDGTMMIRTVRTVPSLEVDPPTSLFKLRRNERLQDMFLDGRFLLLVLQEQAGQQPIVWTTAIASSRR